MDCFAISSLCSRVPYFTNNGPKCKSASFCMCQKWGCKKKKCSFEVKVTIVDLIIIKKLCGVDVAKNNLQSVKS